MNTSLPEPPRFQRFVGVVFMVVPLLVALFMTVFDWMVPPELPDIMGGDPVFKESFPVLYLRWIGVIFLPLFPLFCGGRWLQESPASIKSILFNGFSLVLFAMTLLYLFCIFPSVPGLSVHGDGEIAILVLFCLVPTTILSLLLFVLCKEHHLRFVRFAVLSGSLFLVWFICMHFIRL